MSLSFSAALDSKEDIPHDSFYGTVIALEECFRGCKTLPELHALLRSTRNQWTMVRATSSAPLIFLWQLCSCTEMECIFNHPLKLFQQTCRHSDFETAKLVFSLRPVRVGGTPDETLETLSAILGSKDAKVVLAWIVTQRVFSSAAFAIMFQYCHIFFRMPDMAKIIWPYVQQNFTASDLECLQIVHSQDEEAVDWLVQELIARDRMDYPFALYQQHPRHNFVKALVKAGKMNEPYEFLWYAIRYGDFKTVQLLWPMLRTDRQIDLAETVHTCNSNNYEEVESMYEFLVPYVTEEATNRILQNYHVSASLLEKLLSRYRVYPQNERKVWKVQIASTELLSRFLPIRTFAARTDPITVNAICERLGTSPDVFRMGISALDKMHPLLAMYTMRVNLSHMTPDMLRTVMQRSTTRFHAPSEYLPGHIQWLDTLRCCFQRRNEIIDPSAKALFLQYAHEFGCAAQGVLCNDASDFPLIRQ